METRADPIDRPDARSTELSRFLYEPDAGEVWVAPTPEMLWWTRRFGWLIAPAPGRETWATRAVHLVAVTPSAHVANMSLHFQSFLFDVFHQTTISRVAHFVCMPLINAMVLALFAQVSPALAAVVAVVLAIWYLAQASKNGVTLLGVVMLPVTAATYAGAMAYSATGPSALETLGWIGLLSLVQAASHAPEPKVPPRVTGSPRWVPLLEFLFGSPGRRHRPATVLHRLWISALQILFGALDEFWAAWRLVNLNWLELMWWLGYKPQMRARFKDLSRRAVANGQPAIDYIGVGGGLVIRDPDARA
jgi:hypothetical protein